MSGRRCLQRAAEKRHARPAIPQKTRRRVTGGKPRRRPEKAPVMYAFSELMRSSISPLGVQRKGLFFHSWGSLTASRSFVPVEAGTPISRSHLERWPPESYWPDRKSVV